MTGCGDTFPPSSQNLSRLETHALAHTSSRHAENKKALHPAGPRGKFAALLASFRVDGRDCLDRVETGHTQEAAGLRVHFPAARHARDPTDGPLAVVTTPDLSVTWYLEGEDVWHLDFNASVFEGHELGEAHGLLGWVFVFGTFAGVFFCVLCLLSLLLAKGRDARVDLAIGWSAL